MTTIKLTYEERNAAIVVRKLLARKPDMAGFLLDGMSKECAVSILLKARDELADLLAINRAISAACAAIVKLDEQAPESNPV